jgi:carboxymethylenebutenolidase
MGEEQPMTYLNTAAIGSLRVRELPGYLNDSAGQGRPALVVIHEFWGLTGQIRGVVDRFAKEGFVAFAPDLYRGKLPQTAEEAQRLVVTGDKAQWFADLQRAVEALLPCKVGVVGFSMGGAFAHSTAAQVPEVRACVSFYGVPRPESGDLTKTRARVLGHYVNVDEWVSPERLGQIEAELQRAGVPVTLHRYDAKHSFFNEQRSDVYSPGSASLAWDRTLAFLKDALA